MFYTLPLPFTTIGLDLKAQFIFHWPYMCSNIAPEPVSASLPDCEYNKHAINWRN